MSLVTDLKYASMLSPYVRNFTRKNNAYNFACPYCGDSKKIKSKARGYLFPAGNKLLYKCHNCSAPAGLLSLLTNVDPNLAAEWRTDSFLEAKSTRVEEKQFAPPKFKNTIDSSLVKISTLPHDHPAKRYVEDRMIPSELHYKLYYTGRFKKFANKISPGSFEDDSVKNDEPRLIIPLIDRHHKVMGYQGRSLNPKSTLKYITILVDPQAIKVYGLDTVDINKKIRAFEGPLDAMFIPNSVATTGGRQDSLLQQAGISKDRTIIVYDNEARNIHTIEKMKKGLDSGWTICIWPDDIHESDVNDMIKAGYTSTQLTEIIDSNAYSDLMGHAMLSSWRKV